MRSSAACASRRRVTKPAALRCASTNWKTEQGSGVNRASNVSKTSQLVTIGLGGDAAMRTLEKRNINDHVPSSAAGCQDFRIANAWTAASLVAMRIGVRAVGGARSSSLRHGRDKSHGYSG